jgi:hypothetical protein
MSTELIEPEDPSAKDWGHAIFDEEFPLAIDPVSVHATHLRIIVDGDSKFFEKLRLELSADSDLFFLYEAEFTADQYEQLTAEQQIVLPFAELPGALMELVRHVSAGSGGIFVSFAKTDDTQAALIFDQQLKFKKVQIMRVEFTASSTELVQDSIQFRFDTWKQRALSTQTELEDLCAMLKIKNPSVLKQAQSPRK